MISKYNTPLYYLDGSWGLTQGSDISASGIILSSEGSMRIQTRPFTSNVTIRLGSSGAGDNEGIEIQRRVIDAFTLTVLDDDSGDLLYQFPAGFTRASDFLFDLTAGKWNPGGNVSISRR